MIDFSPEITDSERASAEIMAVVMDRVLLEAASPDPMTNIEVLGEKKEEVTES